MTLVMRLKNAFTVPCPVGTYVDESTQNHVKCTACPVGQYNDELHASECKACPEGTGTLMNGTTALEGCIGVLLCFHLSIIGKN